MKRSLSLLAIVCLALLLVSCSSDDDGGMMGPVDRFVDNGDGTVTDTNPGGLIWLRDADCLSPMTWDDATALLAAGGAADFAAGTHPGCNLTDGSTPGDWRLPSLEATSPFGLADGTGEFAAIFEPSCPAPSIPDVTGTLCWSEGNPFSGVSNGYWSSTPIGMNVWIAALSQGFIGFADPSTAFFGIWPVRDAP